ncbi:agamous-like MADS-box protein AGL29 [Cinnamomum micranthum f. kanehirae]|uniref:Agamous-like MADS-box protein AGL29 n=1 Tax=Cinnamomum micranthum f. kanehirae TaxID=337451 RepID=A0A3S3R2V5_9MAGN|nr:agamous-like MADS-box protein AGL29 [Cinnamomum micranthum f. kanehirae]
MILSSEAALARKHQLHFHFVRLYFHFNNMGKRKIEMIKIEDKQRRFVTLSKRKEGLFKKAKKLALDFGVEVAVIGFTVGGRPFSFGSSSVDDIIDKYAQNHPLQFTEQEKIHTAIHQEKSNVKLINSEGSIGNELMDYASALTMLKDTPVQTMAGISQKYNREDDHSIDKDASFTYLGLGEYSKSYCCNNAPPLAEVQLKNENDINSLITSSTGDKILADSSYHVSPDCGTDLFSTDDLICSHSINDPTFLPVLRDDELDDDCWNEIASTSISHHYTTALQGDFIGETIQGGGFPFINADHMADLWPEKYVTDSYLEETVADYETELGPMENVTNLHLEKSKRFPTNLVTKGLPQMEASFCYFSSLNNQQAYGEMTSIPSSSSLCAGNFEYSDWLLDGLEAELAPLTQRTPY